MASFDFDQAEGLRRMLAGPQPRIVTFLSATPSDDKGAMLVNLGASLVQGGNEVLIVDACQRDYGVARRLEMERHVSLLQVARQECALNQVVQSAPQGFNVALLARDGEAPASWQRRSAPPVESLRCAGEKAGRHRHRRWRTEPRRRLRRAAAGRLGNRDPGVDQRDLDHECVWPDQAPGAGIRAASVRHPGHRRHRGRGESGLR